MLPELKIVDVFPLFQMAMHEDTMLFRLEVSYCQVGCQRLELELTEKGVYGSPMACKIAMLGMETFVRTSL